MRQGKQQAEAPKAEKPEKPVVRTIPTFEDIKKQLEAWAETNRIPGKIQAWYTAESLPEHSDWRIIKTYRGKQESLTIDAPARDMKAPELVTRVFEQLKKEHLHIFSKALRQIWFRAVGDGNYALIFRSRLQDLRRVYPEKLPRSHQLPPHPVSAGPAVRPRWNDTYEGRGEMRLR